MASDAVGVERRSRIIGYKLKKGDFRLSSPNLPQRIAVLAEANEANQAGLSTAAVEITSAQQAGGLFGYGSPIYNIIRILKPVFGDGVGGIPVIVYPQAKASGAVAKVIDITPTGTATGNGTHRLVINGRTNIDGNSYDINIIEGDGAAEISSKIEDAINNVLQSPVIGISTALKATATAKWNGLTSQDISISLDVNGNSLGITYVVAQVTAGSGTPSVATSLASFGNEWNTIVVNSYGTVTSVMDSLEAVNGIPDPTIPTGRFSGIKMTPFVAITGTTAEDPSAITDARLNEVTIALAPAPLSKGLPMEAAANMTLVYSIKAQNTPHLDVAGTSYPDMPTPTLIGAMSSYDSRDQFVKKGCSTVDLVAGKYVIQDFVTTYHPLGEQPPQFAYVRNLYSVDMNIAYTIRINEETYVIDHVIANDDDIVNAVNVIKPKEWKSQLNTIADDLANRALIVDSAFTKASLLVNLGTSNPDRLETSLRYKRSGTARIVSTTGEAGFNFGNV
jgi:phage tail sheath gpL-like